MQSLVNSIQQIDFKVLERREYELKQIWQQANTAQGDRKQALLNEYRFKHDQYRKTKARLLGH